MKINVWTKTEVEIDEKLLPEIAGQIRKEWEQDESEPVYMCDLLSKADVENHINMPDVNFELDDEWNEPLSNSDLQALIESEGKENA
jgi:hypothetical protein